MLSTCCVSNGGTAKGLRSPRTCSTHHIKSVHAARVVVARSGLGDAVDGWLDLAKLVTGGGGSKTPYDELASSIGRDVYVDIAGWHLYTRDMTAVPGLKMSQALAMQLGPQASRGLREQDIVAVLEKIPVKLGAGKMKVSLYDVIPAAGVSDLEKILQDFERRR